MSKLFTLKFWSTAFETILVTALASFAGSQIFVTGLTWKNFAAAGLAALAAGLASFLKQLGGVQTLNATKGAPKL